MALMICCHIESAIRCFGLQFMEFVYVIVKYQVIVIVSDLEESSNIARICLPIVPLWLQNMIWLGSVTFIKNIYMLSNKYQFGLNQNMKPIFPVV